MQKDFDGWNSEKQQVHARENVPFYHEREIWWCALGTNVGSEQDGAGAEYRRPILVLKGLSSTTLLAIPLTTSARNHPLRLALGLVDGKEAHALLSQMRVIDTKRLIRKIGYVNTELFARIRKTAKGML
jgi:mRNA-degrading endonuclease toxin of MazEF toxin-antitoxin module